MDERGAFVTSTLAYCCVDDRTADAARKSGLRPHLHGITVHDALGPARDTCRGRLLVIDTYAVADAGGDPSRFVPPEALPNLDPYRPPVAVAAAGGILTRRAGDSVEVLLIFRRGIWDLPKGKCDAGESIRECAVREVREEVGIDEVRIVRGMGETVHGYPYRSGFAVKTTHWFEMHTTAGRFEPQAEEDIEDVRWFEWREALRRVGFESLRRHLGRIEQDVLSP